MSEQLHPERRPHSDRIREELGPLVDEEGRVIREITDYEASFWGLYPELKDFLNALIPKEIEK